MTEEDPEGLSVALPGGIQGTVFALLVVPEVCRERLLVGRPKQAGTNRHFTEWMGESQKIHDHHN